LAYWHLPREISDDGSLADQAILRHGPWRRHGWAANASCAALQTIGRMRQWQRMSKWRSFCGQTWFTVVGDVSAEPLRPTCQFQLARTSREERRRPLTPCCLQEPWRCEREGASRRVGHYCPFNSQLPTVSHLRTAWHDLPCSSIGPAIISLHALSGHGSSRAPDL
jgi:hypothetical protein